MEHSRLFWGYMIFFGLVLLWKLLNRKRVYLDKYEYLEVMSFIEWKEGRVIRKELEKKHGGWIVIGEFYINLGNLEDEGLVERKVTPEDFVDADGETIILKRHEFRKKPGGIRRSSEGHADALPTTLVSQPT